MYALTTHCLLQGMNVTTTHDFSFYNICNHIHICVASGHTIPLVTMIFPFWPKDIASLTQVIRAINSGYVSAKTCANNVTLYVVKVKVAKKHQKI